MIRLPREEILEKAGVTLEQQADLFQKAYRKLDSLISAKKTITFQYQGKEGHSFQVDDSMIQLKASQEIFNFLGVYAVRVAPIRISEPLSGDMPDAEEHFAWESNTGTVPASIQDQNQPENDAGC